MTETTSAKKPGRLAGLIAVVTGAGSRGPGVGNGKAAAILFAREGASVVLADLHEDHAQETADHIRGEGGECVAVAADVATEDGARAVMEMAHRRYGGVDILHNNVGIGGRGTAIDVMEADWDRVLAVNLKSVLFSSRFAVPHMEKRRRGSIVNMASIAAYRAHGVLPYAASKGGVIAMTITMAEQHARSGIRVNCIVPGPVHTPMVAGITSPERREARRRSVPLQTEGTAWDTAWAAVYLASDEARWVTGAVLPVDGGLSITTAQRYRDL